ncbi:MAG: threonine aldolase family protein [Nocardioidaceae bacterium]
MIDLRSDTVTAPSADMRRAMASADVGDDVYGEDPTVVALEEAVAERLGFEAALFTVTGSMANVLAVRALAGVGQEVLCEAQAHIARAELGAHGALTGLTMRTWTHPRGYADLPAIEEMLAPDLGPFFVRTSCVSVENTHNFSGGRVQPVDSLRQLRALADRNGFGVHVDGARVWNAHVATGEPLTALAGEVADTMTVCLSKGLGAPVGSLVLGSRDQIGEARVWRKRLGGGWRQAGVLAAAGLYALEHNVDRLADDHTNARTLAAAAGVDESSVETNMVVVPTEDAAGLVRRCKDGGVLVSAVGPRAVRVVTHLNVTKEQAGDAAEVLARALAD